MAVKRSRWLAAGLLSFGALSLALGLAFAKDKKRELQEAMEDTNLVGDWNYDDIGRALKRAAKEDKPVLIVFR